MSGNKTRLLCCVCRFYTTYPNRIDIDEDSECSPQEEQQKIKQEVEQDDCDISPNYRNV